MDKTDLIAAVGDVQDLQYRLHCAVELVLSVHTSITKGDCAPDQDSYDALFGAYLLLHTLDEEMKETREQLWRSVCDSYQSKE